MQLHNFKFQLHEKRIYDATFYSSYTFGTFQKLKFQNTIELISESDRRNTITYVEQPQQKLFVDKNINKCEV